jgi:hypothetical protein
MSQKTSKVRPDPPPFPPVTYVNGRGYNWRSQLEHYKEQLVRHALGGQPQPLPMTRPAQDALVPLKITGFELGVGRRTLGRRIKAAAAEASPAGDPEAA